MNQKINLQIGYKLLWQVTNEKLGKLLNVSRTTVWRWRSTDMKSKLATLMQIDEMVSKLAKNGSPIKRKR